MKKNVLMTAVILLGIMSGCTDSLEQLTTKKGIACCDIVDAPAYKWRGLMLDVSRHYFPISFFSSNGFTPSAFRCSTCARARVLNSG